MLDSDWAKEKKMLGYFKSNLFSLIHQAKSKSIEDLTKMVENNEIWAAYYIGEIRDPLDTEEDCLYKSNKYNREEYEKGCILMKKRYSFLTINADEELS